MAFSKGCIPWNKNVKGIRFGGHSGLYGAKNPMFKGGSLTTQGYWQISVNGKRQLQHRYVMEEHMGRKLERWEHVHHINYDKLDNRLENLEVLDSRSHGRESALKRWSTAA